MSDLVGNPEAQFSHVAVQIILKISWDSCLMLSHIPGIEPDINADEEEEKQRLISQVLELQNTLDGRLYRGPQGRLDLSN